MAFRVLSDKLNPVIKPLMDSIKLEENEQLQGSAARTLARLLELCQTRTPCPNTKILKNVCNFLCSDSDLTPRANPTEVDGILMLIQQQRMVEKSTSSKRNQIDSDQANARAIEVQRRGAILVLKAVVLYFGAELQQKAPFIWDSVMNIKPIEDDADDEPTWYVLFVNRIQQTNEFSTFLLICLGFQRLKNLSSVCKYSKL